ncbi:hypothetical protein ACS0TY_029160 [Phlomoides rotata]
MDDEVELQAVLIAIFGLITELMNEVNSFVVFMSFGYLYLRRRTIQSRRAQGNYSLRSKVTRQLDRLNFLINYNDETSTHVPVPEDSTDYRWKYFKGCLGVLDGTYIPVRVPHSYIPRYRNRKRNVSVNVLAVFNIIMCNSAMQPVGRGRKTYIPNSLRVWTYMEKKELVCALKELVVKGHKYDNGFKSGYLNLLENSLVSKFPGTDLKGDPHINSKIHVDPTARGLQKKTFPFYADWCEIFGNDRAIGAGSQAYVDAEQDVLNRTSRNGGNSAGVISHLKYQLQMSSLLLIFQHLMWVRAVLPLRTRVKG